MLEQLLLPSHPDLQLLDVEPAAQEMVLDVKVNSDRAACPLCGTLSTRIHSRYQRHLQDRPCNERLSNFGILLAKS